MNMLNKILTRDKVYLSSKMSGEPDYGYPLFHAMEETISNTFGCAVINPARHFEGRTDLAYEVYLKRDFKELISKATCVVVFGKWRQSRGSLKEVILAISIGLSVWEKFGVDIIMLRESPYQLCLMLAELEKPTETVCAEADRIVSEDRGKDYGHPYDDYKRTTETFNALTGNSLTPMDGIMFMMCVKMSRLMHKYKRDNLTDLCGYAKCYEMAIRKCADNP